MTPEEIRKMAVALAKDWIEVSNLPAGLSNEVLSGVAKEMERVVRSVLRTHCIVSKEKATELCRLTLEHGDSIDYGLIDGLTDIVCDIFREQYHAEAEKTILPLTPLTKLINDGSTKARRKSDGKIIEVEETTAYDGELGYWDNENCDFHYPSDLDFNVEKTEEVTIDGWVARNKDGQIYGYWHEPIREDDVWIDDYTPILISPPQASFPSLTWESEPLEVTITIKPKNKQWKQ